MAYDTLKITEKDGLAYIELSREPLNVLNIAMMKELNAALRTLIPKRHLKAVVLHSTGKAFSAGVDVGEHTPEHVEEMLDVFHALFFNLDKIQPPTIALVNGAALGGGCELALYCDLVVASEKAKFGQPEILVGVFPPVAAYIFPRLLGAKKGLELLIRGNTIKAPEALALGLINQVFPVEGFQESAEEYLDGLRGLSAKVLALTKQAYHAGMELPPKVAFQEIEQIYLEQLMHTHDAQEGLQAFLEKRKPAWENR